MSTLGVVSPKHPSRFFSLPSTSLGKWSARLLVLAIALTFLFNLVVLPAQLPEMAENAAGLTLFVCVLATGVTGLVAIVGKHERSWTAFAAVVVLLFVVAMNLGPLVFGE